VEGVFGDGRKASICGWPASRPAHGGTVEGARISRKTGYKIFDRYQECGFKDWRIGAGIPIGVPISCPST
jgi:hypothetical protein